MQSPDVPEHLRLRKQPKQQRTRELVRHILDVTAELVSEQGFTALNTNSIAQRAGIDVTSLYQFFPNKESILYLIADSWLARLRKVSVVFESPPYLELSWREYFAQFRAAINALPQQDLCYISLAGLWETLPEFTVLERFQEQYFTDFFARQLRRFGATLEDEPLRDLAYYLFVTEDRVFEEAAAMSPERAAAFHALQYQTYCLHLEKILPA